MGRRGSGPISEFPGFPRRDGIREVRGGREDAPAGELGGLETHCDGGIDGRASARVGKEERGRDGVLELFVTFWMSVSLRIL